MSTLALQMSAEYMKETKKCPMIGHNKYFLTTHQKESSVSRRMRCLIDRVGEFDYLFTWNLVSPSLKKALICLAAAIPALMLASAV